jgi:hypothetical protein
MTDDTSKDQGGAAGEETTAGWAGPTATDPGDDQTGDGKGPTLDGDDGDGEQTGAGKGATLDG